MKNKSLKVNSVVNIVRSILSILFPLITLKYASSTIGPEGIGAVNYSQSFMSYFQLIASFGITNYAIAEGSKFRNDKEKLNSFISEVFTINLITTTIAYILFFITIVIIHDSAHVKYLLIYSATMLFTLFGVEWIFTVYEDFGYITVRALIFQIISLLLMILLVHNDQDTCIYVALVAMSSAGSGVLNFLRSRRYAKISLVSANSFRKHIKPILMVWGASIAALIYVNSDIVLLGWLKNDRAVGEYSVTVKIVKAVCVPIASVCSVAVPRISEKIKEDNTVETTRIVKKVLEFMSFFIFPFMAGLVMLAKEAIVILSGPEYLSGVLALRILVIDIFLSPINGFITYQVLLPFGKQKISLIATTVGALSNIVLDIALIPRFSLYGAAFATVFSEMCVLLVCIPYITKMFTIRYLIRDLWKYVVAAISVIPVTLILSIRIVDMMAFVIVDVLLSGFVYIIILLFLKNQIAIEIFDLVKRLIKCILRCPFKNVRRLNN